MSGIHRRFVKQKWKKKVIEFYSRCVHSARVVVAGMRHVLGDRPSDLKQENTKKERKNRKKNPRERVMPEPESIVRHSTLSSLFDSGQVLATFEHFLSSGINAYRRRRRVGDVPQR